MISAVRREGRCIRIQPRLRLLPCCQVRPTNAKVTRQDGKLSQLLKKGASDG
jgi:hypothetical protein